VEGGELGWGGGGEDEEEEVGGWKIWEGGGELDGEVVVVDERRRRRFGSRIGVRAGAADERRRAGASLGRLEKLDEVDGREKGEAGETKVVVWEERGR